MGLLGKWRTHVDYRAYVAQELGNAITKLWLLNLDPLYQVLGGYYAPSGRPGKNSRKSYALWC